MKRFVAILVIAGLGIYFLIGARNKGISYESHLLEERAPAVELPRFETGRPVAVLVRGWLWDSSSRREARPLEMFPQRLESLLADQYGMSVQIVQFEWSRVPTLIVGESKKFTAYAKAFSEAVTQSGGCINFIGHSAGAAMVYNAAAHHVAMGFMGTLGLPTIGAGKPESVERWANFYTSAHKDDIAGRWWGPNMRADVNIDLRMPHRDFWESPEVAGVSADAIARACTVR